MLVSIVLPVYNMEPFLRQCLDSVIHQTYADLQILAVNDGSKDNSLEILREYAARDSRIEVYDKSNEGLGLTRNFAIPHLRGEYVLFMDSDDWLELTAIETLVKAISECSRESSQPPIDMVCMNWFLDDTPRKMDLLAKQFENPNPIERRWLLENTTPPPWGKLIHVPFLQEHGIRFPAYQCSEDTRVHWQCCLLGRHYAIVSEPLYHYRVGTVSPKDRRYSSRGIAIFESWKETQQYLIDQGVQGLYGDIFLATKIYDSKYYYDRISPELREAFRARLRDGLSEEEWRKIETLAVGVPPKTYRFLMSVRGKWSLYRQLKCWYYWYRWRHQKK